MTVGAGRVRCDARLAIDFVGFVGRNGFALELLADFHILTRGVVTHCSHSGRGARLAPRTGYLDGPVDVDLHPCCGGRGADADIAGSIDAHFLPVIDRKNNRPAGWRTNIGER